MYWMRIQSTAVLADVVRLRRAGLVLRPPELETPIRGHLAVRDDDGRHTSIKRAHLSESLVEHIGASGTPRNLVTPIIDVVLLRLEGGSFTQQGIEIEAFKTRR